MLTIPAAIWNLILVFLALGNMIVLEYFFSNTSWKHLPIMKRAGFIFGLALFIILFPNIPYMFSDSRHILDMCSGNTPYKTCPEAPWLILLFFSYGTIAIPFFVITIKKCSALLGNIFSPIFNTITPYILIPMSALGVCLGLFERFNSWEIVYKPLHIIEMAFSYFLEKEKLLTLILFTLCLLGIYHFFGYFISTNTRFSSHQKK